MAGLIGAGLVAAVRRHQALERTLREELRAAREEAGRGARELRGEVAAGLKAQADTVVRTVGELGQQQRAQLDGLAAQVRQLTAVVDERLGKIREGNEAKLEEMRKTVDERLHGTLEKRLGESFKLVSDRLEAVQRGLGEMQGLAAGVGELKRVLTNVKARGTWAEVQLGALLEQLLTPDQFDRNVETREGSREAVEFAIRLPGAEGEPGSPVWLPIDSKFPQEDYLRLLEAAERADAEGVQRAAAALSRAVRVAAQDVRDKYLDPPRTTDFALLFLPTEGLYAEVLRQPGLLEELQQTYRVVVAGPASLAAILTSLRMGFRTLAIERRASEVWQVLAAVKSEFGKFGAVLGKVKRQLDVASRTIDATEVRSRAMERKLRTVEALPGEEARTVLGLADGEEAAEPEEPGSGGHSGPG
jgi:DNA recombination protein RmuC